MLADADLCRGEKPGEIPEQPQPVQRPRDVLPRAGRGRRQLHAAGGQGGQQRRRAVLGGDLIKIEVPQHARNARADLGGRLRQCIVRVQILRALLHAHREQNLVESFLRRDAQAAQIPRTKVVPDAHGVEQHAVQVKNSSLSHAAFSPWRPSGRRTPVGCSLPRKSR